MSYLALGDGPPSFPPDSSCPVVLRIPLATSKFRLRDCHSLRCNFPFASPTRLYANRGPYPDVINYFGLGSSPFAHHYSGNHSFIFSSSGYLDVSVPRVPLHTLCLCVWIPSHYQWCVPTFGYLRIKAYLQLPVAFRSLSRPSSAHSAKASSLRSSSLNRLVYCFSLLRTIFSENLILDLFPQQNIIYCESFFVLLFSVNI